MPISKQVPLADVVLTAAGFRVSGDLTFPVVPVVWRQTQDVFARSKSIEIDLAGVGKADSGGIALLVEWVKQARRHRCGVVWKAVPSQVLALAEVSGVADLLSVSCMAGTGGKPIDFHP